MPKLFTVLPLLFIVLTSAGNNPATGLRFTKNEGQVLNDSLQSLSQVAYYGHSGGLQFFIGKNGLSYQLQKHKESSLREVLISKNNLEDNKYEAYRVDFSFVNANKDPYFKASGKFQDTENFIQVNGSFMEVSSYDNIYLQNIYSGINAHYYSKGGELKCDYIVAPGADYHHIRLKISGHRSLRISESGDLQVETSIGTFIDHQPEVFQNGKILPSRYILNGDVLSFEISGVNANDTLIIDPVTRIWGTFYGGSASDNISSIANDPAGNVVVCGFSNGSANILISSPGAYQVQYSSCYVAKFTSSGARLWCTYYGLGYWTLPLECCTDQSGNIYVTGDTDHSTGNNNNTLNFTSPGAYQVVGAGLQEAFLLKLSPSGWRQWCTFYGGSATDYGLSCATDSQDNIYLLLNTGSGLNNLSSPGAFLTSFQSNMLVKFDSLGNRLWATYYPGYFSSNFFRVLSKVRTDPSDNVVIAITSNGNNLNPNTTMSLAASPNAYQSQFGGGYDVLIAKFDPSGNRLWGTFYGNSGYELSGALAIDAAGNIYVGGSCTNSSTATYTSATCHQQTFGGAYRDGFIAKFSATGSRCWGTLYGGNTDDDISGLCVSGSTLYGIGSAAAGSTAGISMPPTFQPQSGGGADSFLLLMDTSGTRLWSSYYGGNGDDYCYGINVTPSREIYMGGQTSSTNSPAMASAGAFQPNPVLTDGFMAKFYECTPQGPVNNTIPSYGALCGLESPVLNANAIGPVTWFSSSTSTVPLFTGNSYTLPLLPPGTYTWFAEANDPCSNTTIRVPVNLDVYSNVTISIPSGTICSGQVYTITPLSSSTYSYYFSSLTSTVMPFTNTVVQVTAMAAGGCSATSACSIQVFQKPNPAISSVLGFICSGSSNTLIATGAQTYSWSTGVSGSVCAISPAVNTVYTLTAFNQAGCSNSVTYTQFTYLCDGLDENSMNRFQVFPNPVSTILTIRATEARELEYQITDLSGRNVLAGKISDSVEIDLRGLCAGVYLLQLNSDEGATVLKLVKE